jgi:hypothetical protein
MVRLEEQSEEFAKVKATNSVLKTTNEGNAVRIKELELQVLSLRPHTLVA